MVPLKEGGEDEEVTGDNRDEFVTLNVKRLVYDTVSDQLRQLLAGFYSVLPHAMVCAFNAQELELMLCGMPELNLIDWQTHTVYTQLPANHPWLSGEPGMRGMNYGAGHPVCRWFWECVAEFSHEQRARLLQFVTGTARVPVQGFAALQSQGGKIKRFTLTPAQRSKSKYPKAHTCFNQLELPVRPPA